MVNIQLILGAIILFGTRKAATAALPPRPCALVVIARNGDTCQSLTAEWGTGMTQFLKWNAGVNCNNALVAGKTYCLSADNSQRGPTASLTRSSKVPTTTSRATQTMTSKASTGTPPAVTLASRSGPHRYMSGIVPNCAGFHKVEPGDTCESIVDKYNLSLDEFYTWNPAVGRNCQSLWLGYYVCGGVKKDSPSQQSTSQQPTSQQSPSQQYTSQQSNTSQQTQPNVNPKCNNWYQVVPGDYCQKIAEKFNVPLQTFYNWNPSVGSNCASLWAGYNVCVGSA
ncbi:LysM domain-containing protein [Trichophyton mentagrophytes]|nr:LysM domain-containing protein [Trichophyton mentagrophytes]